MNRRFHYWLEVSLLAALLTSGNVQAAVVDDLQLLRNRCLYYAVGHAPNDTGTITLRHGLYAQSPFSPVGEIDLAATGFALAGLPSAVGTGLISSNAAFGIAATAAVQVRSMVEKSAAASKTEAITNYGFAGMLFHYYIWNEGVGEFRGKTGGEVSSIDTCLTMYGLLVCANYFGGAIRTDYEAARDTIHWRDWLDTTTAGHMQQFRMAYRRGSGFSSWWDCYTHEAMLICVFAAMSDPTIDPVQVWRAWKRDLVTYVSPGPDSKTFTCYATYFGDPFTVFYGLAFLDFSRFPPDLDGVKWFEQGQIAYQGHVEFFGKERGYLDHLTFAFFDGSIGAIARPKSSPDIPVTRTDAALYSVVGGLAYYAKNPEQNELAQTLSNLIHSTPGFYQWHGWPVATIDAVNAAHAVADNRIVGQDIALIGLAIDNYLTNRIQNLVLQDARLRAVLNRVFPPRNQAIRKSDAGNVIVEWAMVPFTPFTVQSTDALGTPWSNQTNLTTDVQGMRHEFLKKNWATLPTSNGNKSSVNSVLIKCEHV